MEKDNFEAPKYFLNNIKSMRKSFEQDRKNNKFSGAYLLKPNQYHSYQFQNFEAILKKAKKLGIETELKEVPQYPEHNQVSEAVFNKGYRVGYKFPACAALSDSEIELAKSLVDFHGEKDGRTKVLFNNPYSWLEIYDQELIVKLMNDEPIFYCNDGFTPRLYSLVEREELMNHYSRVLDFYEAGEKFLQLSHAVEVLSKKPMKTESSLQH